MGTPTVTFTKWANAENVITRVGVVRSFIPKWREALDFAAEEASAPNPDDSRLTSVLEPSGPDIQLPWDLVQEFNGRDQASEENAKACELVGTHVSNLVRDLEVAGDRWHLAAKRIPSLANEAAQLARDARDASKALGEAMQHALFLTFLQRVRTSQVGEKNSFDDYCAGWGLTPAQIQETWTWMGPDTAVFDHQKLPVAYDHEKRAAYRQASKSTRWFFFLTPLWGAAVAFGVVAGFLAILAADDILAWPKHTPVLKLAVLFLFVLIGAIAHVCSRWANVNYEDPIQVTAAGGVFNWVALRWLSILMLYLPVAFVVTMQWWANGPATSKEKLLAAVLAGYSADSALKAAFSKLPEKQRQQKAAAEQTTVAAASASTFTPIPH